MAGRKLTKREFKRRVRLVERGLTDAVCAAIIGISEGGFSSWRWYNGIPPGGRAGRPRANYQGALTLYNRGFNDRQIGGALGICKTRTARWRYRHSLPRIGLRIPGAKPYKLEQEAY